ncbi:MAG: Tetratricopeptide TPR_2 repeat protein [Candidatus Jettenia ecosi]|uniref:Tetratricopeptide TPR_2 repeat protein n=1 Tax=Candidatus Jettenia ecosi TaxID=2494326 RepID=A0A533QBU1_9BACT|nr:MAG: Tetratricopeptide TPR_2 repeat protein [Candidatus Jettenia ecosi]
MGEIGEVSKEGREEIGKEMPRAVGEESNGRTEKEGVFLDKKVYAMQYAEMGLVDLAISELKKMKELYPDDIKVHAYLGWAYSQKGRISDAVEEFQKALEVNPDLQRVPFDYPMAKDIPAIIKEFTTIFEDLIDQIDSFSGAHEVLGLCYVLQGRLGDAFREYRKVLQRKPAYEKRDLIVYGKTLVPAIDQAITEYEEIVKSQPDCVEAYITLACAYAEKGMLDEAMATMKKAISAGPDRMDTHMYLGCFYAKRWMMDKALEELYKAKNIRTYILERLLIEGERFIQNDLFEKTIDAAKDAVQVSHNDKRAYELLALAYSKSGMIDKAIETCKETIRLYPDNLPAYLFLGWIYLQSDLPEEAKDLIKQATLVEPENADLKAIMAFMYATQNQIHQAIEICAMIMNKPRSHDGALKDYSWVKGGVPSIEQKLREVMDVLELKPDYQEAYICLGWLYAKNGEAEKAIASYRKALELISASCRRESSSNAPNDNPSASFFPNHFNPPYPNLLCPPAPIPSFSKGGNGSGGKGLGRISREEQQMVGLEERTGGIGGHTGKTDFYDLLYTTHVHLGNIYVQKGEIQAALNEYNKAQEVLSGKAQDDIVQGLACLDEGDAEQAIQHFNAVLKINPQCKEVYFFLADAYEKKGLYSAGMVLRLQGEKVK